MEFRKYFKVLLGSLNLKHRAHHRRFPILNICSDHLRPNTLDQHKNRLEIQEKLFFLLLLLSKF